MGRWYVIANLPTFYEKNSFNPIEGYELNQDGTIYNYYESNRGSFLGPRKRVTARAWVVDESTGAEWRVQFFWPISFAYQILEIDPAYRYAVVGHPSKKYVWIMAREPEMSEGTFGGILSRLIDRGYDVSRIQRCPQEQADRLSGFLASA